MAKKELAAIAKGMPMTGLIAPEKLKEMLGVPVGGGCELALLDLREEGVFARGHLLFACSLPLSRLELRIRDLVPRLATRLVLLDGGGDEDLAARGAVKLESFGYTDVNLCRGGPADWAKAGFELFTGVNVPSKAFGEFIEAACETPHISAQDLKSMMAVRKNLIVLDSRPLDEYRLMSIPGAIDCPGAELVYRVHDLAPSSETLVVVNCAGRTRSIIGAQSLINAGIPHEVVALRNGTMGWHLAGYRLERNMDRRPPPVSQATVEKARVHAEGVAKRAGVTVIDRATLARWQGERDDRTLYIFDVRQPEEYEAGHLPGSLNAPGGQLVQKTDVYIGVRGARIVLADDTGVRSRMTASWLVQMGIADVAVLDDGSGGALHGVDLARGAHTPEIPGLPTGVETVAPKLLAVSQQRGKVTIVDLGRSIDFRAGHIPGAWFAIRSRLASSLAKIPRKDQIVLTSEDGTLARLAAPEAAALLGTSIKVVEGGTAGWKRAGFPLAIGLENMADEPEDIFWRPYDRDTARESAMKEYLGWELGLMEQIARDGGANFRTLAD